MAAQGWRIAACDLGAGALETAELVRERGGEALGLTWDVRDGAAAKQAHAEAEAEKELGPVEAVVANAATEEVAATVAFLCSDAAGYITGARLLVEGGMSLSNLTLGRER